MSKLEDLERERDILQGQVMSMQRIAIDRGDEVESLRAYAEKARGLLECVEREWPEVKGENSGLLWQVRSLLGMNPDPDTGKCVHETRQQEECGCSMHCYNFKSSSEQVCKGLPVLAGCAHSDTRSDGADAQECTACGAWRRRYPVMPNGPTDWGPWLRHQSCTQLPNIRILHRGAPDSVVIRFARDITNEEVEAVGKVWTAAQRSQSVACTKQEER